MALLQATDITRTFVTGPQIVEVLKGVSLTIEKQEFMSITGKSGSGKTTLMNILGCLDTPTTGTYLIEDKDVSDMSVDQLAHIRNIKVGFVFQRFNLLQNMSALENVALPQLYAGKTEKESKKRAQQMLEMVGLNHRLYHFPTELSGGEQQRVAVARALVNAPPIILADEPTGNLDSATGQKIMQLFKDLNKNNGVTFIIITHDVGIAEETDRIVRLLDGRIIEDRSL